MPDPDAAHRLISPGSDTSLSVGEERPNHPHLPLLIPPFSSVSLPVASTERTGNPENTESHQDRPSLSLTRAARLRRIVRDGEEIVRRLERLHEDLQREIPEAYRAVERGSDRANDLLSDIQDAFDRTAFFASGQAQRATDQLNRAEQPVRFTRRRTSQDDRAAGEGTEAPPLWNVFASEDEGTQDTDTDQSGDQEGREGERPPWTNL